MATHIRRIIVVLGVSSFILHPSSFLCADGGTVRLSERKGAYQITVFTSPTPFRAGPVDISVFVQNVETGQSVTEGQITVRIAPRGRPTEALRQHATTEAATNKLYHAALFDLPEAGWWEVEVAITGLRDPIKVRFSVEADPPLPEWLSLWPWIGWPVVVVVLYCVHRWLVRRQASAQGSS